MGKGGEGGLELLLLCWITRVQYTLAFKRVCLTGLNFLGLGSYKLLK